MQEIFNNAFEELKIRHNGENLDNVINIDSEELSAAQEVVDAVNAEVSNRLKDHLNSYMVNQAKPLHLEGSIADGTKVLKPDEFDYSILLNLPENDWDIVPVELSPIEAKYLIDDSEIKFFWSIKRRKKELSFGSANEDKKVRRISDQTGRIQKSKSNYRRIHSRNIIVSGRAVDVQQYDNESSKYLPKILFEAFSNCLSNLETLQGDKLRVKNVTPRSPAITLTVFYDNSDYRKFGPPLFSDDFLGQSDSVISIDYVPTLRVGNKFFVVRNIPYFWDEIEDEGETLNIKQTFYWCESFSYEEVALMKELRTEAEQLHRLYKYIKGTLSYINDICYLRIACAPCDWLESAQMNLLSKDHLDHWDKSFSDIGAECVTYHLKTVLLHLYKCPELWRGADINGLTKAYFNLMDTFCNNKDFPHFFNGKHLLFR